MRKEQLLERAYLALDEIRDAHFAYSNVIKQLVSFSLNSTAGESSINLCLKILELKEKKSLLAKLAKDIKESVNTLSEYERDVFDCVFDRGKKCEIAAEKKFGLDRNKLRSIIRFSLRKMADFLFTKYDMGEFCAFFADCPLLCDLFSRE